jgi:3-oxoacyl-[acyl-carrier protein] reductase
MGLLTGKTALVTGAARGIGKAVAMKFASEGANIAFTDLVLNDDMAAGLEATRKEIEALGVTCRAYAGNAADFEETEKTVKQIHADFGSIDILVNNAGITKDGLMLRMSEAQWDAVLNVNLKSAFNFIHACSPIMLRQRSGSIINMASVVGVHGNAGQCNYAASKAGMIALAKSIAQELGPKGVRANAVAPGFIETAMTAQLPEEIRKDWMKKIPLRRGGQTEDIANVCLYLSRKGVEILVRQEMLGLNLSCLQLCLISQAIHIDAAIPTGLGIDGSIHLHASLTFGKSQFGGILRSIHLHISLNADAARDADFLC